MKINFIDSVHPVLSERLSVAGHTCEDLSELEGEMLFAQLFDAEGVVIRGRIMLDAKTLDRAPKLKFIARAGAGLENIDQQECAKRNIRIYNSPEGNSDAVGEHAIAMLLALMNHLIRSDREVRGGKWRRKENTGHELNGSTVGIIGFGRMGRAFAQKLQGFGVKMLAYDKYLKDYAPEHVRETSFDELMEKSDVISLHLPLNDETNGFVNARFFAQCARPIWFINTARGQLVDTTALLDAIDNGRVRGACLDTLEFEERSLIGLRTDAPKEVLQRLFKNEHVILSPHTAGITHESYFKLANVLADKILGDINDGKL